MHAQPLIAVHDVQLSSQWYQAILGCESGHGGSEYEQIVCHGRIILQIHHWDTHDHSYMGNQDLKPYGNGVILWFQADDFDGVVERAKILNAKVLEMPKVNPNANHREFWLRDPDGYLVVIAGRYGDLGVLQSK